MISSTGKVYGKVFLNNISYQTRNPPKFRKDELFLENAEK